MALVPCKSPIHDQASPRTSVKLQELEKPLDYSFKSITHLSELSQEEPRSSNTKNKDKKYDCRCIRLNNNVLAELNELTEAMDSLLMNPHTIGWLDLSFNELTKIDSILCNLQSLEILYLHGNSINDITEMDKLSGLPLLTKLTLHGNDMCNEKFYRSYVLSKIPALRNLDFSAVTKSDRATATGWERNGPPRKRKKKAAE